MKVLGIFFSIIGAVAGLGLFVLGDYLTGAFFLFVNLLLIIIDLT
jgi:hypothetical protein